MIKKLQRIVLDTSAILTLLKSEAGADRIEELLVESSNAKHELYVSIVSMMEVFYTSCYERSEELARERLEIIRELPLTVVALTDDEIETVGTLKSKYKMSFADCCVAGLALRLGATLVHKDPEFEQLKDRVVVEALPYKASIQK